MVYMWVEEKHACVDLARVMLLVGWKIEVFTVGHKTLKVASNIMVKHNQKHVRTTNMLLYYLSLTLLSS
jgi:hypothetical protein